jgi:hypothetical protein
VELCKKKRTGIKKNLQVRKIMNRRRSTSRRNYINANDIIQTVLALRLMSEMSSRRPTGRNTGRVSRPAPNRAQQRYAVTAQRRARSRW